MESWRQKKDPDSVEGQEAGVTHSMVKSLKTRPEKAGGRFMVF